jgi:hypothetical protein
MRFGELEPKGGEVEVNSKWNAFRAAAGAGRYWDRSLEGRAAAGRQRLRGRAMATTLIVAALMVVVGGLTSGSGALAQRVIEVGAAKRTATVSVYIGKSEDVRTDTSFVDISVATPQWPTSIR